jgi:hypothetical protein
VILREQSKRWPTGDIGDIISMAIIVVIRSSQQVFIEAVEHKSDGQLQSYSDQSVMGDNTSMVTASRNQTVYNFQTDMQQ